MKRRFCRKRDDSNLRGIEKMNVLEDGGKVVLIMLGHKRRGSLGVTVELCTNPKTMQKNMYIPGPSNYGASCWGFE